ncbi:hypothetical protein SAMN04488121_102245 [Chitinophaga filiformis]|uniref:Uncharacterized protein n=1 Tax=Chitinophaga filiformis TaxID=104663 RepID=A0A1G7M053_CHIFI|nr:hypothetical protein SAMN04488121_102245 [Chitinophaga filiformis]
MSGFVVFGNFHFHSNFLLFNHKKFDSSKEAELSSIPIRRTCLPKRKGEKVISPFSPIAPYDFGLNM